MQKLQKELHPFVNEVGKIRLILLFESITIFVSPNFDGEVIGRFWATADADVAVGPAACRPAAAAARAHGMRP